MQAALLKVADQFDTDYKLWTQSCNILRTACINSFYYEQRLWWANFWYLSFEITIALGATGSSVAAWALWKDGIGVILWAIISGFATLISILKPILAPAKRLELITRQHQGWYSLYFAAEKLMRNVRLAGSFNSATTKTLDTLSDRMVSLHLEDEKCRKERLLSKCQARMEQLISHDALCWPAPSEEPGPSGRVEPADKCPQPNAPKESTAG
ncbi:MAG: hypothetical protein ABSC06_16310 [Rhodopila sp.]|jgi:hypothetical protein